MKKLPYLCIAAVLLIGLGILTGFAVKNSPELALLQIAKDVREYGLDGLMPHLTGNAESMAQTITDMAKNEVVAAVLGLAAQNKYAGVLTEKLHEVQWQIKDILKGHGRTTVILRFCYEDAFSGTVSFTMERVASQWKISDLNLPVFNKVQ